MPGEMDPLNNAGQLLDVQNKQLRLQNDYRAANNRREQLRCHAKSIGACDGDNMDELRKWIANIDATIPCISGLTDEDVISMATTLMRGSLKIHVAKLLQGAADAQTPLTWEGLKKEVQKEFLESNEEALLREIFHKLVQYDHENTQAYTRRFKEALRYAYSATDQAYGVVKQELVKKYINGLRDVNIKLQVNRAAPDDLEKAYAAVVKEERARQVTYDARAPMMSQYQPVREEEPMEIGATGSDPVLAEVRRMQKSMEKGFEKNEKRFEALEQRVARLKSPGGATQQNWRSHGPQQNRKRYNPDIKCFGCGQKGHIERKCPHPNQVNRSTEQRLAAREVAAAGRQSKN